MRNDLTKTMDITKLDLCTVANHRYVTLFASTNGTCSYALSHGRVWEFLGQTQKRPHTEPKGAPKIVHYRFR